MKSKHVLSKICLVGLMSLLFSPLTARAADPGIEIHIYDDTNLDPRVFESSTAISKDIFSRAGVNTTWVICPGHTTPGMPAECSNTSDDKVLFIRVIPRLMRGNDNGLGTSFVDENGVGSHGLIFYPKVQELSQASGVPVPGMLALAVSHEIGHLLLGGAKAHWPSGIMSPVWDRKVVHSIIDQNNFFNGKQAEKMKNRLLALDVAHQQPVQQADRSFVR